MKNISFRNVDINGGFWKQKQDMLKTVTVHAVYDRFKETHRFDALKCQWKPGMPDMPHIFWDSDVAKWIEGVAYLLEKEDRPELKAIVEEAIDDIIANSDENGYFNSHYLVREDKTRFTIRNEHELYCAGHFIEAAVAYYKATGEDRFLKAMCKYADYIEKCFKTEKTAKFVTPGHPELELALVKLYEATGEKRYYDLAAYFIDEHGKQPDQNILPGITDTPYNQDEMLLKDRNTIDGHSVRALYLYCGAADIARLRGDSELTAACQRIFENVVNKRMYVTGGVGSTHIGETFTVDYDLPSRRAYTETCAAIALVFFASRMQELKVDSRYADCIERVLYNGFLSGISLDGKSFFYENPLEIDPDFNNINYSTAQKERFPITQRLEVFDCSCCPPNIVRFIPSIADHVYGCDSNTVYINQFMDSTVEYDGIKIKQSTDFPTSGKIKIDCYSSARKIAIRIPGWCREFKCDKSYTVENGYAVFEPGTTAINVDMGMPIYAVRANRRVHDTAGRIAIMRGPVVYCAEGVDNGRDLRSIRVNKNASFQESESNMLLPSLHTVAFRPKESDALYFTAGDDLEEIPLTLIPYYAFANRGETEMCLWLLEK